MAKGVMELRGEMKAKLADARETYNAKKQAIKDSFGAKIDAAKASPKTKGPAKRGRKSAE